ncbi:hypothetical protein CL617_02665 [archaeon]|nr:hypothetical protein [archaeon]|tara:strand:- start:2537 stop:2809 length:273 start_codon:yes stop_codon:yes gene_type:complete
MVITDYVNEGTVSKALNTYRTNSDFRDKVMGVLEHKSQCKEQGIKIDPQGHVEDYSGVIVRQYLLDTKNIRFDPHSIELIIDELIEKQEK